MAHAPQGNTSGSRARISSLSKGRRIPMSETITTTGRFSILGTGRLVVTVRQTGGAPGAILTLSEIIQGQNADIIDQIGIAALNTTYVIDVPVAGSDAIVDLTNLPGGAASFVVTIQGAGTT